MAKKKIVDNLTFVNNLMNSNNRLTQVFILEAISVYSQLVAEDPQKWTPALIHPSGWKDIADDMIEAINNRF